MRYEDTENDVPIRSKTNQAYRDNWDRVFGEEPTVKTGENTEDVADAPLPPAEAPPEPPEQYGIDSDGEYYTRLPNGDKQRW